MALTGGTGPLSSHADGRSFPSISNGTSYAEPYGRRVRGLIGGTTVIDTEGAVMLHGADRLVPEMWFPAADVQTELLATGASAKPAPGSPIAVFGDMLKIGIDAVERWLEEDQPVVPHFRDPYHRVDVLISSRHVRVAAAGETVAETTRPLMLCETSLPNRWYVPWADARTGHFVRSEYVSGNPYSGEGQHWHLKIGDRLIENAAWSYPNPLAAANAALEHVSFYPDKVELWVDGSRVVNPPGTQG